MEAGASHSSDKQPNILLHAAELIKYRDERKTVLFTLVGGQSIEGVIRWFDDEAIHIVDAERAEMTLFKHAVILYRAR